MFLMSFVSNTLIILGSLNHDSKKEKKDYMVSYIKIVETITVFN